jgi:excisionase family DNA binding protein
MDPILVSVPDAARLLGLGRSSIYAMLAAGRLDSVALGRRRLIRYDSVRAVADGATAA